MLLIDGVRGCGGAGPRGVEPGALRRAALVLLQSCGPAIAERILTDHSDGFSGAEESQSAAAPASGGRASSWQHTAQACRAQVGVLRLKDF